MQLIQVPEYSRNDNLALHPFLFQVQLPLFSPYVGKLVEEQLLPRLGFIRDGADARESAAKVATPSKQVRIILILVLRILILHILLLRILILIIIAIVIDVVLIIVVIIIVIIGIVTL